MSNLISKVTINAFYYPLFFVPFTGKKEKYTLHYDSAVQAQDVTPPEWNVLQRKWEIITLNPPQRQRPVLEAIISTLTTHLPEIVQQSKALKSRKKGTMRRFLGQFPLPLREGIDEKAMHGTIGTKDIEYKIYEHELSTYVAERTPEKSSPYKLVAPIRAFNHG